MSNWGDLFEKQAQSEGEAVANHNTKNDRNFGFNAPGNLSSPPQTSFGNTSANRMDRELISRKNANLDRELTVKQAFSLNNYYSDDVPELLTQTHSEGKWGFNRDRFQKKPAPVLSTPVAPVGTTKGGSFGVGNQKSAGGAFGSSAGGAFGSRRATENACSGKSSENVLGATATSSSSFIGSSLEDGQTEQSGLTSASASASLEKNTSETFGSFTTPQPKTEQLNGHSLPTIRAGGSFGTNSVGGSFGGKSAGGAFGSSAVKSTNQNQLQASSLSVIRAGGAFGMKSAGGAFGSAATSTKSANGGSSGDKPSSGGFGYFGTSSTSANISSGNASKSNDDVGTAKPSSPKPFGQPPSFGQFKGGAAAARRKEEEDAKKESEPKSAGGAFGTGFQIKMGQQTSQKSFGTGFSVNGGSTLASKQPSQQSKGGAFGSSKGGAFGSKQQQSQSGFGAATGSFGTGTPAGGSFGFKGSNNSSSSPIAFPSSTGFSVESKAETSFGSGTKSAFNQPRAEKADAGFNNQQNARGFSGGGRGGGFVGGPKQFGNPRRQPVAEFDPQQKTLDTEMPVEEISLLNKYLHAGVPKIRDDTAVVQIHREDPTSPLYSSAKSFRELRIKPEIFEALDKMGFEFPTRIQETSLPLLLMEPRHNLIAQAQSGTGKTAAFVITMLCRIDLEQHSTQCICLAPTLELAQQIGEVVEKMGQFMKGLSIHYAIKGAERQRGVKLTSHIVIGTPGKLWEYLKTDQRIDPQTVTCLVLDEADVMITQQGVADRSIEIYRIVESASPKVQSMLFSATYDTPVIEFATSLVKDAIVVTLKKEDQALQNIKQFYVECPNRDAKYEAIVELFGGLTIASSVIFCHTRESCYWLCKNLMTRGHSVAILLGDMSLEDRVITLKDFKDGKFKVLITTNVFARGIDVSQVSVVINYDLPVKYEDGKEVRINGVLQPDYDTYLHRIGRTGRFGKSGIAINFIDSEKDRNMIRIIEDHFAMKICKINPADIEELERIDK